MLVVALGCATVALILAAAELRTAAMMAAAGGFAVVASEVIRMSLPRRFADPVLIARLVEQAQQGRKLAIYDRDTGLFAHWYLALRGQEECARAERYDRPLTLLILEPSPSQAAEEWTTKAAIGGWIQTDLRSTDIAGYLGNGRYAVLAPEADAAACETLVSRLRDRVREVEVAMSAYGADGDSFEALWRQATVRLMQQRLSEADAA
jgi:GGDEF domain-containing protein